MANLGELDDLRSTLKLSLDLCNRFSNYINTKNHVGRGNNMVQKLDDELAQIEAQRRFLNFKGSLLFPKKSPSFDNSTQTTQPLNLCINDQDQPKLKKTEEKEKENVKLEPESPPYIIRVKSPKGSQMCNFSLDLSGFFDVDDGLDDGQQTNNKNAPSVVVVQPIRPALKPKMNTTKTTNLAQRRVKFQEGTGKLIHAPQIPQRLPAAAALSKPNVVQNQNETPYQIFEKYLKSKSADEKSQSTTGKKRSNKMTGIESILAKPKKPRRSETSSNFHSLFNPMLPYPSAAAAGGVNNQAVKNANDKVINSLFGDARFPNANITDFNLTIRTPMQIHASKELQDLAPPWLKPKVSSKKIPHALQALYDQHKLRNSNANNNIKEPVVLESMKDLQIQYSSRISQPKVRGPTISDPFPSIIPEHLLQPRNDDPEMHQFKTMFLPFQKQHLTGCEGPNLETFF